jgi:hypothetical protein
MRTNNILSILLVMLLGWVGCLSAANASVGANPDDYTKKVMLERFNKVKADIYYASKTTGMDMADLTAIASIESGLISGAKNRHSSASGMLGHTKGTWAADRKAYHSKLGVAANAKVSNPRASLLIGAGGLMESKRYLVERTHLTENQIQLGDQYMSHFLGRDTAVRVLNSKSGTPMNRLVRISPGNRGMFVKPNGKVRTAREFRVFMNTLVERERAFYKSQIKQYVVNQERKDIHRKYLAADDQLMMAQSNTFRYVGWSNGI